VERLAIVSACGGGCVVLWIKYKAARERKISLIAPYFHAQSVAIRAPNGSAEVVLSPYRYLGNIDRQGVNASVLKIGSRECQPAWRQCAEAVCAPRLNALRLLVVNRL
jgi:hypothetical protein